MQVRRSQEPLEAVQGVLAPKRRGHGMALPQRLRMMAIRLEAGLRETPQRFIPLAFHIARIDEAARRRFLHFLVSDVQREAFASSTCPPAVLYLLARARHVVADASPECDERRRTLADDILAEEAPRRGRRHIHCHGAITSDRRLLFLRSAVSPDEADAFVPMALWRTIAYAMSDYDVDHFVMRGAHIAVRVRALAAWVEREIGQSPQEGEGEPSPEAA